MEVEETGGRSVCLRVVTILANMHPSVQSQELCANSAKKMARLLCVALAMMAATGHAHVDANGDHSLLDD